MFQMVTILGHSTQSWLSQLALVEPFYTPLEETATIFSGSQFFVTLLAGVLMAFAFQFLLTNFSIAAGISSAGDNSSDSDSADSLGKTIRKIESKVGIWILLTVNIALFIACFLAVKLSLINSVMLGAISGVVIWSGYFLLLIWASSTALGSLVGSLVNTATSGLQGVMSTATAAIGGRAINQQVVSTAEASVSAITRELKSALDPTSVRETVEDYLGNLQQPKLDVKQIRNEVEKLLNNSDLKSIAGSDLLSNINRQTFIDLVSSRTDFSKEDSNRIADQLESVWQQVAGQKQADPQAELVNFLKSANPEDLRSDQLPAKLGQLLESRQDKEKQSPGLVNRALQLGLTTLVGTVLERTDLSDLDVEKISSQLQKFKDQATEQASQLGSQIAEKAPVPALPFNTIKADVENYLLSSQAWHLNRETIKYEFRDVIYDPEAAPGTVRRQLEQLNRDYFMQVLQQRNDFTPDRVNEIAEQLESMRMEVLDSVQTSQAQERSQDLRSRVENYLGSTGKEELNPEGIAQNFQTLLEDPEAGVEALSDRLSQFDRDTLLQLLKQRQDVSDEEAEQIVSQLEESRDRVLTTAQELQDVAKSQAAELRNKVEEYLRNTNKEELNPEGIKRDLQILFDDPQAGLSALRARLSQFDRDTLVQLLSQRQDLSEEQINSVIDQIGAVRDNILQAPQKLAGTAKEQYEQITSKIAEYLRNTNKEELNPEGIKQDLAKLLDDPKEGALALRDRLSHVDRESLVKLLSQREDLSEEQVNQIIDRVQESIRSIVKAPRRLASRAQTQVRDFGANLEAYLRNTNKEELKPEGIKRDLQLLLNDPKAGLGSISDRLGHFDRSTIVALLSQREDISEEEANQIVEQIESVRNSFVEQIQNVQHQVQSVIDGTFGNIKNYLNSLERPELDYEGIQQDLRQVFDDPQAGFEAVRDRVGQFDRDTLVAILSSREDISEEDANRIIGQIEGVRDSVLKRAERLQQQAQRRIDELKRSAVKQAEETRKTAATAAWWLFGTALTSVIVSAIAGIIAVAGLDFFG